MIKLRYLAENRPKHTVKIAVSVTTLIEHQITRIPRSARQAVEKRSFADASITVTDRVQPLVLQSGNQHAQRLPSAGEALTIPEYGSASCGVCVCQYVYIVVVAVYLTN